MITLFAILCTFVALSLLCGALHVIYEVVNDLFK